MQLIDIAEVFPGYPFRGRIDDVDTGGVPVVNMKDVTPEGGVNWGGVQRAELEGRRTPDWLCDDDILFAAKGYRNWAALVRGAPPKSVCTPLFFHFRVKRPDLIRPDYLAWYINQEPAQVLINRGSMGTGTPSVRREFMEQLSLVVPPLATQVQLMGLFYTMKREAEILAEMQKNRATELKSVMASVLRTAMIVGN